MKSINDSTLRQYSKPIRDWSKYCEDNNIDTFKPEVERIVEWLTLKFEEGLSYSALNSYRSAISFICGEYVGKNPLISRLLKGMYNVRPAKPRYNEIYDLDPVIQKLKTMFPLSGLSLSQLTSKLAMLLALITAHRNQTIFAIELSQIRAVQDSYEVFITQRIKTSGRGQVQPILLLPRFRDCPPLCVASTLEEYLKVTSSLRGDTDALFITTRKPFRAAAKDTISRWIRAYLGECGIAASFTTHSVRHAATSAAFKQGVELSLIKKLAGWSESSQVFNRFYNRPVVQDRSTFARAVMRV